MSESKERWLCARCAADSGDTFFAAVVSGRKWKCPCGSEVVVPESRLIQDPGERERSYQRGLNERQRVEAELLRLAADDASTLVPAARTRRLSARALISAIEAAASITDPPNPVHRDFYVRALVLALAGRAQSGKRGGHDERIR